LISWHYAIITLLPLRHYFCHWYYYYLPHYYYWLIDSLLHCYFIYATLAISFHIDISLLRHYWHWLFTLLLFIIDYWYFIIYSLFSLILLFIDIISLLLIIDAIIDDIIIYDIIHWLMPFDCHYYYDIMIHYFIDTLLIFIFVLIIDYLTFSLLFRHW